MGTTTNGRNEHKTALPPDNPTGNFTKIIQRIPVKIVFDQKRIPRYNSRITPGISAEVSVEVKY